MVFSVLFSPNLLNELFNEDEQLFNRLVVLGLVQGLLIEDNFKLLVARVVNLALLLQGVVK
jgi:hypothetical protein